MWNVSRRDFLKASAVFTSALAAAGSTPSAPRLTFLAADGEGSWHECICSRGGKCIGIVSSAASRTGRRGPRIFASSSEALSKVSPDVIIFQSTETSHEKIFEALAAGAHVLAPVAVAQCVASADELIRASQAARRWIQTDSPARHLPLMVETARLVQDGLFGKIRSVEINLAASSIHLAWRSSPHGLMGTLGFEILDHVRAVLPSSAEMRSVYSTGCKSGPAVGGIAKARPQSQFASWHIGDTRVELQADCLPNAADPIADVTYVGSNGTIVGDWFGGWAVIAGDNTIPKNKLARSDTGETALAFAWDDLCEAVHERRLPRGELSLVKPAIQWGTVAMAALHTGHTLRGKPIEIAARAGQLVAAYC